MILTQKIREQLIVAAVREWGFEDVHIERLAIALRNVPVDTDLSDVVVPEDVKDELSLTDPQYLALSIAYRGIS